MKCKICGEQTNYFDKATIIGKYVIEYFHCPHCGFVQTEDPYWLNEAYSSAITNSDIGLIQRNIMLSEKMDLILKLLGNITSCLDYGGGYGMFVRMMRDKGWDFEWYDEYCENIFAQMHKQSKKHYDLVTSFEVLEHLSNPMDTLEKIFALTDTLVCTTEIIQYNPPKIDYWWYYCVDHGQHISFYSKHSLEIIAERFGMKLFFTQDLIVFSTTDIPTKKIEFTFNYPKLSKRLCKLEDKQSLLSQDYYELTGKRI